MAGRLSGTAIPYDQPARIRTPYGPFDEVVSPRALSATLARPDVAEVALLRDHQPFQLLARVGAGTLTLLDEPLAMRMRADVADTPLGRETVALVRRRDLSGMSFSFAIASDSWYAQRHTPVPLRVVDEVRELFDVSVVTYPAYPQTTVAVDEGGIRPTAYYRSRALEARIAASGGLYGTDYGRRISPPAAIRRWCLTHSIRRGRQPLAHHR